VSLAALLGLVTAWAAIEPEVSSPSTPARWELVWQAPSGCPDAAAIREQVAALVPTPREGEGVLLVQATITPQGDAFVLVLRTDFAERHDEREARGRVCSELGEAVALVVAVSLDPSLVGARPAVVEPRPAVPDAPAPAEPPSRSSGTVPSVPSASPTPDAARPEPGLGGDAPSHRARRSHPPSAFTLRLAPKLELGSLPAVAGGLELAVGLAWRWWRLELHGAHAWPRRALGPGGSAGRFQLGAVGVRGCGRPRAGPVELPVCVGLEGGALRVDSEGLRPAVTVHGPWLVQSLGVGLAAGGPRVGVWTLLEGSATLVWSRILVGEQTLFRPFPVSARWLAGVELRFAIESR
jgi:hypothetical protein